MVILELDLAALIIICSRYFIDLKVNLINIQVLNYWLYLILRQSSRSRCGGICNLALIVL